MNSRQTSNPNEFLIKQLPTQDDLKTSSDFLLSASSLGASAIKTLSYSSSIPEDSISLHFTKEFLDEAFKVIKKGDLSLIEEVLLSQALALNVAFTSLSSRANRQKSATTMQMLMTLSFKAQNQSRAALQALIDLKQPTQTAFIKQTNIAHGHQQVNNSLENNPIPQNELLKDSYATLDARGTIKTK
jgi:hypothetical protein